MRGTCSFIVPAYNASTTLAATVSSIHEAAASFDHEIVIVDDASLDDTHQLALKLGDVVASRACQAGAGRARNDAALRATGDVFFFVDSDVTVTPEAVGKILRHIDEGADAAFGAYSPLPPEHVRNGPTIFKNLLHHFTHLQGGGRDVTTFWSGFSAITREAFFEVKGFDPKVTWSADVEDIHLGYRLTAAGKRIVLDPTAQVMHHKRYTLRRIVMSDLLHRAIPWTKAMLELRTFTVCLNLRSSSVASSLLLYASLIGGVALPFAPLAGGAIVGAGLLGWVALNLGFLRYAAAHWKPRGALRAAPYLALMNLYAPPGALLGVVLFLLRGPHHSIRNTVALEVDPAGSEFEVTVAVVLGADDDAEALSRLPEPEPWWELLVVGHERPKTLPPHATFLQAVAGAGPRAQSQAALDNARGTMFALLSAREVPVEGWLDRVRIASGRGDLAVGGSFGHDRRGARARALGVLWHWGWRPEQPGMWMQDHPPTNCAYLTSAAQRTGGFRGRMAMFRRLSAYGARPVRFDPAMRVDVAPGAPRLPFFGLARFASASNAARVHYYDYGLAARAALIAASPFHMTFHLVRLVVQAIHERSADRTFFASLPQVVAGAACHEAGVVLGLIRARRIDADLGSADLTEGAVWTTLA